MANRSVMMLFVQSRLRPTSTATEEQYHNFYNIEMMDAVMGLGQGFAPKVAMRFKNLSPDPEWPYAAVYTPGSSQMLYGPIREKVFHVVREIPSPAFNGAISYEHIEYNTMVYRILHTFQGGDRPGTGAQPNLVEKPLTMICDYFDTAISSKPIIRDELFFTAKYEAPWRFTVCENYIRSTSHKLVSGKAARYLITHEFDCTADLLGPDVLKADENLCVNRQIHELIYSRGFPEAPEASGAPEAPEAQVN